MKIFKKIFFFFLISCHGSIENCVKRSFGQKKKMWPPQRVMSQRKKTNVRFLYRPKPFETLLKIDIGILPLNHLWLTRKLQGVYHIGNSQYCQILTYRAIQAEMGSHTNILEPNLILGFIQDKKTIYSKQLVTREVFIHFACAVLNKKLL